MKLKKKYKVQYTEDHTTFFGTMIWRYLQTCNSQCEAMELIAGQSGMDVEIRGDHSRKVTKLHYKIDEVFVIEE